MLMCAAGVTLFEFSDAGISRPGLRRPGGRSALVGVPRRTKPHARRVVRRRRLAVGYEDQTAGGTPVPMPAVTRTCSTSTIWLPGCSTGARRLAAGGERAELARIASDSPAGPTPHRELRTSGRRGTGFGPASLALTFSPLHRLHGIPVERDHARRRSPRRARPLLITRRRTRRLRSRPACAGR